VDASPADSVLNRIRRDADAFSGGFAFFAKRLDSGEELGIRPDDTMPPASAIKLAILAEFYRQSEQGRFNLNERVELTEADRVAGSGVLRYLDPGLTPTWRDLARLMIILSDNVATSKILRLVGVANMHRTLDQWGLSNTRLFVPPDPAKGPRGFGTSTPRELATFLERIHGGTLVSEAASAEMKDLLAHQQYGDQVPRWLPFNLYAGDRGEQLLIRVYNKTGFTIGVRVDAALVETPAFAYVIATMNEASTDLGIYPDNEGNLLNAAISRLVYDYWVGDSLSFTPSTPLPPFVPLSQQTPLA
jgi:beta-lactamase class A